MELGTYYYFCHKEYDKALEELRIAEPQLPNNPRLKEIIAWILRRKGQFDESNAYFLEALTLNPRDAQITLNYANSLVALRRYPEAKKYFDKTIAIRPDQVVPYCFKAVNYWHWMGTTEEARGVFEEIPNPDHPVSIFYLFWQHIYERDYRGAIDALSSAPSGFFKFQFIYLPWDALAAFAYQMMDEPVLARQHYELSRKLLLKELELTPANAFAHSALGLVYAGLGDNERAIKEGKSAVDMYSPSNDALVGSQTIIDFIHACIMVGEYDTALEQIDYVLSIPSFLSPQLLKLDPRFEPLHDHPRFRQLAQMDD
jgi:tetratricopeptide (TPR) repeat protein